MAIEDVYDKKEKKNYEPKNTFAMIVAAHNEEDRREQNASNFKS